MYKKKNIQQYNKEEVNHCKKNKNNKYNINMEILSSIKSMPSKPISLGNKKNPLSIKDSNGINQIQSSSSDIELNISPNYTCSTSFSKDMTINKNKQCQNYLSPPPHSIFKPIMNSSNYFNCFNYLPNFSPPLHLFVNPNNSFISNHCCFCGNKFNSNYNLPPHLYNNDQINIKDNCNQSSDKYTFLNKKREADDYSLLKDKLNIEIKNEQNDVFDISTKKDKLTKINNNNKKTEENPKTTEEFFCKHNGCKTSFKTKKLETFHHFKMSPECHDDSICLLKLIYETKKILLKNNKKKNIDINTISSLYEDTMKDLSLVECVKMYTGFQFNDIL